MTHSMDNNSNSIRNALFEAAVQLSVPSVTSTASLATKVRTLSTIEEPSLSSRSPPRKLRYSVSALTKRPDFSKSKVLRDIGTQSATSEIQSCPNHLDLIFDSKHNPAVGTASISAPSKEYLAVPQHNQSPMSPSSPSKSSKSLKNALLGIWQGLNSDEIKSTASSPLDFKYFDGGGGSGTGIRMSSPRWKAFSKVVTSLLTFTRTKKERYEWIQLVGHPGTFKEGLHDGYVMKELCKEERRCCELLQMDQFLQTFVPRYNGTVQDGEGKCFIEMQDLLASFHEPCIMDCKIGVRTYLEEDLEKSERDPQPRADLYNKMIAIDPNAPTDEEHAEKKLLKPRYMIWRESLSSSEDLGFRIEAIKKSRGLMSKEFQRIKARDDIRKQLSEFIANSLPRATRYLNRLIELRSACLQSQFFQTHELIGSSLLFVHDANEASLWMIDFGKTRPLPAGVHITHSIPWTRGSHEDGYLFGLDNLISLFRDMTDELQATL